MNPCVFCEILSGHKTSSIIYRDSLCVALMDVHPINTGHVLVIPIEHSASLAELPPDTGAHLFKVAQRVAGAIRASDIRCEGINILLADGAAAGQSVFHVHLHVVPRFRGDGFPLHLPALSHRLRPRAELDSTAESIRRAMNL